MMKAGRQEMTPKGLAMGGRLGVHIYFFPLDYSQQFG